MGTSESTVVVNNEDDSNAAQEIIIKVNAKYGEFDQLFSKFDMNTDNLLDDHELISTIKHYSHVRPEFKLELNELLNEMETGKAITNEDLEK